MSSPSSSSPSTFSSTDKSTTSTSTSAYDYNAILMLILKCTVLLLIYRFYTKKYFNPQNTAATSSLDRVKFVRRGQSASSSQSPTSHQRDTKDVKNSQ